MPLTWTTTISSGNLITSSAMMEIKNNMDITYDKLCYTHYSTQDLTKDSTVRGLQYTGELTSNDLSHYIDNDGTINTLRRFANYSNYNIP